VSVLAIAIVVICLIMGLLSFVAFCAFCWLRIAAIRNQIQGRTDTAAEGLAAAARREGAAINETLDAAAKLLEQAANFTEKLSKAPPPVVALVSSICFILLAIGSSWLFFCQCNKPREKAPAPIVASVSVTSCRLESFDDGDPAVPPKPNQEPADCLNTLITRLLKDHASFIVLVGHSDLRELRPKSHRLLGDNGNLAYQRGQSVKNLLISRYAAATVSASGVVSKTSLPAIIVLNAGASQGGDARAHPADLSTDRAVEILSFWTDIST